MQQAQIVKLDHCAKNAFDDTQISGTNQCNAKYSAVGRFHYHLSRNNALNWCQPGGLGGLTCICMWVTVGPSVVNQTESNTQPQNTSHKPVLGVPLLSASHTLTRTKEIIKDIVLALQRSLDAYIRDTIPYLVS